MEFFFGRKTPKRLILMLFFSFHLAKEWHVLQPAYYLLPKNVSAFLFLRRNSLPESEELAKVFPRRLGGGVSADLFAIDAAIADPQDGWRIF